jgi:hypothetical protein
MFVICIMPGEQRERERHEALFAVGYLDSIFSHIFILRYDERNKEMMINEHPGTEGRLKWKKVENRREIS